LIVVFLVQLHQQRCTAGTSLVHKSVVGNGSDKRGGSDSHFYIIGSFSCSLYSI